MSQVTLTSHSVQTAGEPSYCTSCCASCCSYLLEKIAQVWQAVCELIAAIASYFTAEAPKPLIQIKPEITHLPLPLLAKILSYHTTKENVRTVVTLSSLFYKAYKKTLHQMSMCEARALTDDYFLEFYKKAEAGQDAALARPELQARLARFKQELPPLKTEEMYKRLTARRQLWPIEDDLSKRGLWSEFFSPHTRLHTLQMYWCYAEENKAARLKLIQAIINNCPSLGHIRVDEASNREVSLLLKSSLRLESLSLHDSSIPVEELNAHPYLKKVSAAINRDLQTNIRAAAKVQKLVHFCVTETRFDRPGNLDGALLELADHPSLTSLRLSKCPKLEVRELLPRLPHLTKLDIHACPKIGTAAFISLMNAPKLRELVLDSMRLAENLLALPDYPHLRRLSLSDCMGFDLATLLILRRCQNLNYFFWSGNLSSPSDLFTPLASCKELQELTFYDLDFQGRTQDLVGLVKMLLKLKVLSVRGCTGEIDADEMRRATKEHPVPLLYYAPEAKAEEPEDE